MLVRACLSLLVFGTGGGSSLRLGGFLVVRGAGGSGGGLAGSELPSTPLDTELAPGRERLVADVDIDPLLGRPWHGGFSGSLQQ